VIERPGSRSTLESGARGAYERDALAPGAEVRMSEAVSIATPPERSPEDVVAGPFALLRDAWRRQAAPPDHATRAAALDKLHTWTVANQDAIARAISADFGHRSRHETLLAEVFIVVNSIRHTRRHLRRWMRPEPRPVDWTFLPGTAKVVRQPRGVVGVLAPWNYPFQLALLPLVGAIAAGNRVLIKPSEHTPATAALLTELVRAVFPPDYVDVVTGGPAVGAAFTRLPFDHLFFTGSTAVGRAVMRAAAENLTPVTLELGGKSPVIVHGSFDVARAAARVTAGKLLNAGQTCIAPDYALVHTDKVAAFADAMQVAIAKAYPRIVDNPDYTSIATDRHHARLRGLLDDAVKKGATLREVNPANESADGTRKIFPTLVLGATAEMAIMQEEIFGPLLPIVPVDSLDQAVGIVNEGPRPLALYYFDDDGRRAEQVLARTTSGGATVNDTLLHIAQEDLPFGGVGDSGIGSYHGYEGFRTFSHEKGVFQQSRLNSAALLGPPYGTLIERILRLLIG
jgi:acyl-CoA reductase-like NAD-dependent aldehyde dehydrogenase